MSVDHRLASGETTAETGSDADVDAKAAGGAVQGAGAAAVHRIENGQPTGAKPIGGLRKFANLLDTVFGDGGAAEWRNKPSDNKSDKSSSGSKSGKKGGKKGGGGGGGGGDDSGDPDAPAFGIDSDKTTLTGASDDTDDADPNAIEHKKKGDNSVLTYKNEGVTASAGSAVGGKSAVTGELGYKVNDAVSLKGTGTAGNTETAGFEMRAKRGIVDSKTQVKGSSATETLEAKKDGVDASLIAGETNDRLEGTGEIKYKMKSGFSVGAEEKLEDKSAPTTSGEVRYQKSAFGIGADAKVDSKDGPSVGGTVQVGKKGKDGFDLSITGGAKGISASATVQIHKVRVGVVFRNGAILTVTLDLGPKHPDLNEALRIALGMASAAVNPIPFSIGVAFRLARKLFSHKKKKPAAAATPAQAPASPATTAAGGVPEGGNEPVSLLTMEDLDALSGTGLMHPSGFLNFGLSTDAFTEALASAPLDESQRAALAETYVGCEPWLPDGDGSQESADPSVLGATEPPEPP